MRFLTNYLNYRCQEHCILHLTEVACQEALVSLAFLNTGAVVENVALASIDHKRSKFWSLGIRSEIETVYAIQNI